jgi:uroporphyrinogen decarboxylase
MFEHCNNSTAPVGVGVNWGPCRGIKNGYMFGFERFMEILMEEPETLEEVFDFWADFQIRLLSPCIDKLKIDVFFFNEDGMAYKNSTLVSPATFGRVYQPYMKRVTDFLRSKGVSVIGYYTSGNLKPLIPSFLDIGINMIGPVEVAAGMDAVELRKEYGRDLLMMGNISRESVMRGKAEIEKEVMRKVPYLMEAGGYIPALDDMVMPDMRFEDVRYCVDLIRSVVP